MADYAAALRARLIADSEVAAIAAERVYWLARPQGSALPAIRLQTISDPLDEDLHGYIATQRPYIQADCFASSYGAAFQLGEKVKAALANPAAVAGVQFGRIKAERLPDAAEDAAGGGTIYTVRLGLRVEHRLI